MKSWQKWAIGIGIIAFIVAAPQDASHIVDGVKTFISSTISGFHLH